MLDLLLGKSFSGTNHLENTKIIAKVVRVARTESESFLIDNLSGDVILEFNDGRFTQFIVCDSREILDKNPESKVLSNISGPREDVIFTFDFSN
jgi:hypothetical protein